MTLEKLHLILVLDSSGSMLAFKDDIQAGILSMVSEASEKWEVYLSIYTFNTLVSKICGIRKFNGAFQLPDNWYHPDGTSALYDALGHVFTHQDEEHDFDCTAMMIFSDGFDNASTKYHRNQVSDLIINTTLNPDYEVYLLTPSGEYRHDSHALSIPEEHSVLYAFTHEGVRHVFRKALHKLEREELHYH